MSLVDRNNANSVPKPRSRRRKVMRLVGVSIIGCLIIGTLLWTQRTTVAEWVVRHTLSEQGYDADLSITDLSGSHARIERIHLSVDGKQFFSASNLDAFYDWRVALKGQIGRVNIIQPKISAEIDDSGNIIWPHLPVQSGNSGAKTLLPHEGIFITDGQVSLNTPFGNLRGMASGKILNIDKFDLSGTLITDQMNFKSAFAQTTSTFHVKRDQGVINAKAMANIPNWKADDLQGQNLRAEMDSKISWDDSNLSLSGPITVNFDMLRTQDFELKSGTFSSDGILKFPLPNAPEKTQPIISTRWAINFDTATLTNNELREKFAETLTLNPSLMGISATAPFAPGLKSQAKQMFENVNVQGQGNFKLDNAGLTATLSQSLKITGANTELTISAVDERAFYAFNRSGKQLVLNFNADIDGPRKASLTHATLIANSATGLDIERITNFDAIFKTLNTWRASTPAGRLAKLSPLTSKLSYENLGDTRHLSMTGALNYDGDIPGGYVQGLKAHGKMRLHLSEENLTVWFHPTQGSKLRIKEMDTVSDWLATDIDMSLISSSPIYNRSQSEGLIETSISNGSGTLVHKTRDMDLTFDFETADISGTTFRQNGATTRQVWNIDAVDAHMVSDTIPTLGTDIKAPALSMTATLEPGKALYFTADSPSIDLTTPQMSAQNLKLSAAGTSETLRADYANGTIAFAAMPLPPLPIQGFAKYSDGAWSGDAVTYLERAEDIPIDVAYRFEDGVGTANISVSDLPFTPRGLQPKHLLPAFGGKVAQVKGLVDADIKVGFGGNTPLTTSAKTTLKNISMGTLPGPITGLNADLIFSSLYPPQTDGPQTLTIDTFDPGLPLTNGEVSFALIPDGIEIYSARWPMGAGFLSLDPTDWKYSRSENRMNLRVDNVSLSEFLQGAGGENFKVTGDVTGELPVVISGVNVLVEDGILAVKNGGVIQYSTPQTNAAAESNEIAGYAFDALKNFEYRSLEARLNGPLDGDIDLRMVFAGRNRDVLAGAEFLFNVGIQGQLFNIAKSFQTGPGITATVVDELAKQTAVK